MQGSVLFYFHVGTKVNALIDLLACNHCIIIRDFNFPDFLWSENKLGTGASLTYRIFLDVCENHSLHQVLQN